MSPGLIIHAPGLALELLTTYATKQPGPFSAQNFSYAERALVMENCYFSHGVRDKTASISQTIFSSVFSSQKMFVYCFQFHWAWWRHQMETFSALLAMCAGNSSVSGEIPAQRPVTQSFDVFFDLRLNKRLSKQSWGWWFETLSCPLWRQCNGLFPRVQSTISQHWFR